MGENSAIARQRYTLSELAAQVGMTGRSIRNYATKRLVDKPLREGRVAVYTDLHRRQLDWVRARFERDGLPLTVIRREVAAFEREHAGELDDGARHPATGTPRAPLADPAGRATGSGGTAALLLDLRALEDPARYRVGDVAMPVSVCLEVPPEDLRIYRLLRSAHRLADAMGYVHAGDVVVEAGPFWRLSTWHRVEPEQSAAALAVDLAAYADSRRAPGEAGLAGQAFEELLETADTVPVACVRVGPVLVVKHRATGGGTVLVARSLTPADLENLDRRPRLLASPAAVLKHLAVTG